MTPRSGEIALAPGEAARERRDRRRAWRPGLDVQARLDAGRKAGERAVVRVRVEGGEPPVRVFAYLDGAPLDVEEAGTPARRVAVPVAAPGRHALTVRAIDALGRWGGKSLVLEA